ncbi:MAG: hypothetical protein HC888_11890 [Candidatus Competibacteraceae bacterium]|nr:hypothetical protein [Candidatus Competibacteraceae bacterium]
MGVYTGDGYFVHSASEGSATGVILSALRESYYRDRYRGARRLLEWKMPSFAIRLGDNPGEYHHPRSLDEGAVRIEMSASEAGVYRGEIRKDGGFLLGRRLAVAPGAASGLWFSPSSPGTYTVEVASENGTKVAELVFAVN